METENVEIEAKPTRNVWQTIISIFVLIVISSLCILTVVAAFIPKDFNFGFNAPDRILIYTGDSSSSQYMSSYNSDSEEYKKIMELYDDSFKTTFMASIFQGISLNSVEAQDGYKRIDSITKPYIEFRYYTSQTITLNGEKYVASLVTDTDYISVIIEVKDSASMGEVTAYFRYKATGTNVNSYVRFKTFAAQSELYEYITKL